MIVPTVKHTHTTHANYVLTFTVRCTELPDTGSCRESLTKWYYNPVKEECSRFNYGGCQGNENRFDTQKACTKFCRGVTGWLFLTSSEHYMYIVSWKNCTLSMHRKNSHTVITHFPSFTQTQWWEASHEARWGRFSHVILFPAVRFHLNFFVDEMSQYCRLLPSKRCQYFLLPQAVLSITCCYRGGSGWQRCQIRR